MCKSKESTETAYIYILFMVMISIIVIYGINFYSAPISDNPSNWGVLGDYFGGILNPIISFTALIYLAKAYSSQKQELTETRRALEETAQYNLTISEIQKEQRTLMENTFKLQQASMIIEIHYKKISYLQDEINRASTCKYESSLHKTSQKGYSGGFIFFAATGSEYKENEEINSYIKMQTSEIKRLRDEIHKIQSKINCTDLVIT